MEAPANHYVIGIAGIRPSKFIKTLLISNLIRRGLEANMKKIHLLIIISISLIFQVYGETRFLTAHLFMNPGFKETGLYGDKVTTEMVLETIRKKTGTRLLLRFSSGFAPTENIMINGFMNKLHEEIENPEARVDLILLPEEERNEFINTYPVHEISGELIKEKAPNIYSMFPKSYWLQREKSGNLSFVPVREDRLFSNMWLVEKDMYHKLNRSMDRKEIIKYLHFTEREEVLGPVYNNGIYWLNLIGIDFPEDNIFYLKGLDSNLYSTYEKDVWNHIQENIPERTKFISHLKRLKNNDFSAVLLNTNYRKYENESITFYEQLFKKADQAEYEVISELEIWKQIRVNRYDYRYFCVPEEGDLELVLMILNILQEQSFGDLIYYGIEGTDWKDTGTLECKIGANAYYHNRQNVRAGLSMLTTVPERIGYFMPEDFKKDYINYWVELPIDPYSYDYDRWYFDAVSDIFADKANSELYHFFTNPITWRNMRDKRHEREAADLLEELQERMKFKK